MYNLELFGTTNVRQIQKTPGIYFLVHEKVVVYVGQSVNVYGRAFTHTDKVFDSVYYLPCPENELLKLESQWIAKLKPIYNMTGELRKRHKHKRITLDWLAARHPPSPPTSRPH